MTPTGVQINKPVSFLIVAIIVVVIIWFKMSKSPDAEVVLIPDNSDLEKVIIDSVKDFKVKVAGKKLKIAYRKNQIVKSEVEVLFLHGQSFKSETWITAPMFTLQMLSKAGYTAYAIDLPGFGDSPKADVVDKVLFMEEVIKALGLHAPVIVSPSMSGGFSLPYLFKDAASVLKRSRGFVPVAPVSTDTYTVEQYKSLNIPTLIIVGEKDKSIGTKSTKDLKNLPKNELHILKEAGHACYLNRPDDFHKYLIDFLATLNN